jgi:aminopeptidase N
MLLACFTACGVQPALCESSAVKPPVAQPTETAKSSAYRLPDTVIPSRYELEFTPDPEKGKFSGSETVELKIKKSTASFSMNANDLLVANANLLDAANKAIPLQVKLDNVLQ